MGSIDAAVLGKVPFKKIAWMERDVSLERRPDGVMMLRSPRPGHTHRARG